MKICFLVGSMKISGGTYVIIQHANYLKRIGHEVMLAVQEPFTETTIAWHDCVANLNVVPISESLNIEHDVVVATWWKTALELFRYKNAKLAYFVQSIESRFYPADEIPLIRFIGATYDLDVHFCTEAKWIQKYLEKSHRKQAHLVKNGIRKDLYRVLKNKKRCGVEPRILVEGPFGVTFKNTGMAVAAARRAGAKDIWVLTGTPLAFVPYASKVFSRVTIEKVPEIYRCCDILIKLSTVEGMFGPPLEMFHCGGTALVLDVSGHEEYMKDGVNSVVVESRNFDDIVNNIKLLIADKAKIVKLKDGALQTAREWPDWDLSSKQFADWIEGISPNRGNSVEKLLIEEEQRYIVDEKLRLENRNLQNLERSVLRRLIRILKIWPAATFQILAIWEVIFPNSKAH